MSDRLRVALLLPLLTLAVSASAARGQGWTVEASAGGARYDPVAAEIDTRSAVLGVQYQGTRWLYAAGGAPLDSDGLPWGAGGLGGRWETRLVRLDVGADLAAHAFGYRDPSLGATGGGGTVEVLPFVAFSHGDARLEVRTGVMHYRTTFDGERVFQQTLHHSAALLTLDPSPALRLSGEVRIARSDAGDYPFAGALAELALGRGDLWAQLGRWLSDDMTTPVWSIGGSLRVAERVHLRAAYEQESEDPLYWNLPRRSWSVGVSRALGRPVDLPPPVAVAPQAESGGVTIRLPLSEAASPPAVGGDFNDWKPTPMTRSGDAWVLTLPLQPGVYRYAFQRADGTWFVPESVPNRVDDGFGGHSAVLVVSASAGG